MPPMPQMRRVPMQETLDSIFAGHSPEEGELIPILQDIQGAVGYLPPEALSATAEFLNIPETVVYGVATFYSQFYLTRQGKHRIKVCQGTACHVRGGKRIMQAVRRKLGIDPGETTEDYMFSLERVACLGSCALSPVVMVDGRIHGEMTPSKTEQLLSGLSAEAESEPAVPQDGETAEPSQ